jgi:hypothetical protein
MIFNALRPKTLEKADTIEALYLYIVLVDDLLLTL